MTTTLLDIAKANGSDDIVGLVEEAAVATPEVTGMVSFANQPRQVPGVGDSRTIRGISYKTLIRTALPTTGFRDINEGTAATKSTYENRTVETFTMNPRWTADKAAADRYEDGAAAWIAMEAMGHMESAFQTLGKQFYYGTNATHGHAKGFPGLLQSYDSANMVVDAGGTTATTGSSLWAVRFGVQDVRWVWGNDGELNLSDVDERDVDDSDGNPYTAYFQELHAYAGLQVLSTQSIGRIKKLTEDANKGLTDDRISDLLAKFKVNKYPHALFASRRSIKQLQQSRTATNPTGAPAPWPTEAFGVPLLPTESISDVEDLAL